MVAEAMATPTNAAAARLAARILLDTRSVLFRPEDPFVFTSGRHSPVYVDCRRLISFPRARRTLMALAEARLAEAAGVEAFDAVAGGETAGIPYAAWLAERLALPMLYVRKEAKGFGRDAQIEGALDAIDRPGGPRVLLVEDLATDGGSKRRFIQALRHAGAQVAHVFVMFSYGIFPQAEADLAAEGVELHALATWHDAVAAAEAHGYFTADALAEVRRFLADPEGWSKGRGGV